MARHRVDKVGEAYEIPAAVAADLIKIFDTRVAELDGFSRSIRPHRTTLHEALSTLPRALSIRHSVRDNEATLYSAASA